MKVTPSAGAARRSRPAALVWGVAFFAAAQLGLALAKACWRPDPTDPEYGRKLVCLRQRLAERRGAEPLIVALGSSRTSMGLRTEILHVNRAAEVGGPLVFNFGMCQFGPTGELMCLHRLLADGVRPDVVLLEVFAGMLLLDHVLLEQLDVHRLRYQDQRLVGRYVARPGELQRRWWQAQLVPWSDNRFLLLNNYLPAWLADDNRMDMQWRGMAAAGWVPASKFERPRPEWDDESLEVFRGAIQEFRADCVGARALRELCAVCREKGIATVAVLLPESARFRAAHSSACLAGLERYLDGLHSEFGTSVVDARAWLPDDSFVEGVHLTHLGAAQFTMALEARALSGMLREGRR